MPHRNVRKVMPEAIYHSEGALLVPTDLARGPWSAAAQHGGPPAGLLARAILGAAPPLGFRLARLTVDLFRTVPMAPLEPRVRVIREARRLVLVSAELLAGGEPVALAHGALLAVGDTPPRAVDATLDGPEGLTTGKLLPDSVTEAIGHGFHSTVDVRWVRREHPCGAWFGIPCALVAGDETHPVVRAAAISDFVNAMVSIGTPERGAFINTDTTVHFAREPEGSWMGLSAGSAGDLGGVGYGEAFFFDASGCFGKATQSRLANTSSWRG